MINLLPPLIKDQIDYSKKNVVALRYLWLSVGFAMLITGVFVAADLHLGKNIQAQKLLLAESQQKVSEFQGVEKQVMDINSRLQSISTIQSGQSRFSNVLTDISAALPKGAHLTSIALTGDDKKPLRLSITTDSYTTAVGTRTAFERSPRFSGVDIEGITAAQGGYRVNLSLAFKQGLAK